MKIKTCQHCGGEVKGQRSAKYCSDKCRVYAWRKRKNANEKAGLWLVGE